MKKKNQNDEKWYDPEITDTGWEKDMRLETRRDLMLKAHGGDYLASGRAMQSLANVTKDKQTQREAQYDADYFFRMNKRLEKADQAEQPDTVSAPEMGETHTLEKYPTTFDKQAVRCMPYGRRMKRISRIPPRISKPMPRLR